MSTSGPQQGLRVLQVLAHDATGGTELMVAMLAPELRRQGMDVEVAFMQGRGPTSALLERDEVPTHSLGAGGAPASVARLAMLLRTRRFDVINTYGIKASLLVRTVAPLVSQPAAIVCGVQGLHVTETERPDSRKAAIALRIERLFSPLIDLYETNSHGAIDVLVRAGIEPAKLRYVPNGVDLARWPMRREAPAAAVPVVLCIARFVARKRQADVVHAAAILRSRGVRIRVVFAGTGPTLKMIKELVSHHGLDDDVQFLGEVNAARLCEEFEQAVALCLVSTWEGMPAAAMEAMARGVPVVGSDVNGINDLIEDSVTGLLVPSGDPRAIADAIARLLSDVDLCRRLATSARALIEGGHTLGIMAAEKRALYSDVTLVDPAH